MKADSSRCPRTGFDQAVDTASGPSLAITVGTRVSGNKNTQIRGILTLTPAATLLEAAAGNGICTSNAGGGDCLPTTALDPF